MSRRIIQERRVRAIAAIHVLFGGTLIVGSIGLLAVSMQSGPRAVGALGGVLVGVSGVIGGAIFTLVAWLLWMYKPFAKWTTGAVFALATAMSVYLIVRYTANDLIKARSWWVQGAKQDAVHVVCVLLIEILVVAWSVAVLAALFRPDSRDVFTAGYRKSIAADCSVRIPFYSSPYFVAGVLAWLFIGCAVSA
jgi:hypothetical protein